MELTVALGVMLRGTVPRNGLCENNHPKAPSQPQTCASSWLSPPVRWENSLYHFLYLRLLWEKILSHEKLRNVPDTRLNIPDRAAIASSLDLWAEDTVAP